MGCADTLLHARTAVGIAMALSGRIHRFCHRRVVAILAALGISGIGLNEALVVYCFALGVGLIIPIPIDLGLTELSGLAVLVAFGVTRADALTVMLMQRVLSSVLTGGIAIISLFLLRRQVAAALRPQTVAEK